MTTLTTITECTQCAGVFLSITDVAERARIVPGTGTTMDCQHDTRIASGRVDVRLVVHLALSTVIRHPSTGQDIRDTAHMLQEWLSVPEAMRTASRLPHTLTGGGYDVTDVGLATARLIASLMAKSAGERAFYWKAATSILRVKFGRQ